MSASNLHLAWARLFFSALAASGVRRAVLSPGSRSTPLVLAAAAEPAIECFDVVDERSAAFFALGQARLTGEPTALVCTSGTAPAHYLPAVIEASQAFLPLVVVSADRPFEASDAGAPQTIDQVKLFGGHVRHAAELGLPDASPAALRAVSRIAAQAAHRARWPTPGPVHVNARFRKPLEPVDGAGPEPWRSEIDALLAAGPPRTYGAEDAPDDRAVAELAAAVGSFARQAGFPVLAEATSQLAFGVDPGAAAWCPGFDAVLRSPSFARRAPDLIVELGAAPTSSSYAALLDEHPRVPRFVLSRHGWSDPAGTAAAMVHADPYETLRRVGAALGARREPSDPEWLAAFARAASAVRDAVAPELGGGALPEGAIAHDVVAALGDGAVLAVGNSMPIRDLDLYAPASARSLRVLHQRGANGIDGLVSGAAGAASAASGPVALYAGDLAAVHDLGGLAAARRSRRPLVIVVVQNDGGRIFEELPIAKRPELAGALEAHFTTPQGIAFEGAAASFGVAYARVTDRAALAGALRRALAQGGCTLVEAVVPPHDAVARRRELRARVRESLGEA